MRLIAMCDGVDDLPPIDIIPFAGRAIAARNIAKLQQAGIKYALVIVDTTISYFEGDEENSNKQQQNHAEWLRAITEKVPGNPTLIVLCHPPRNAGEDALTPRGGSSFTGAIDGNLGCVKQETLHFLFKDPEKFRGNDFDALRFIREPIKNCEKLKSGDKYISTVTVRLATDNEVVEHEITTDSDEMKVLQSLSEKHKSLREIAKEFEWYNRTKTALDHYRVDRAMKKLKKSRLIDEAGNITNLGRERLHGENVIAFKKANKETPF
jgi:hypothetical protein